MTKWLTTALTASFQMLMCGFGATTTINGITWYYTVSDNNVIIGCERTVTETITGRDGSTYEVERPINRALSKTTLSGRLTIPSIIEGKMVVEIGWGAFADCAKLTRVTIPSSITNIEYSAFWGCAGLTSITIPDNVKRIGDDAFFGCSGITSVTIPSSVTEIGSGAFSDCDRLANVTINGNDTFIGTAAFARCTNLTDVTIPIGLKGISPNAFWADDCGLEEQTPFALRLEAAKVVVASRLLSGDLSLETSNPRYNLTQTQSDRAIASLTIDADTTISNFVLSNGKVYDTVLRIVNTADNDVRVILPNGYEYETVKGATPLTIPANSKNILTITRTADNVFLVSRRELETVQ